MALTPRKKKALMMLGAGVAALVIAGDLLKPGESMRFAALGSLLTVVGPVLLALGLYRFATKEKLAQPVPVAVAHEPTKSETPRKPESASRSSAIGGAAIVCFMIGFFILSARHDSMGISAERAGEIAGNIFAYALVGFIILGSVMAALKVPYSWASAGLVGGVVYALIAVALSQMMSDTAEKNQAAKAAVVTILTQIASGKQVKPAQYPVSEYGEMGYALTAISSDVADIQQRQSQLVMKEQEIGSLGFNSLETFTDPRQRAVSLQKIESLREINMENMQSRHDLLSMIQKDIASSNMSAVDKASFLSSFNKSSTKSLESADAYVHIVLSLDDLEEHMLKIADSDHPRLMNGKIIFNDTHAMTEFRDDAAKLTSLTAQMQAMRASIQRAQTDSLNSYKQTP